SINHRSPLPCDQLCSITDISATYLYLSVQPHQCPSLQPHQCPSLQPHQCPSLQPISAHHCSLSVPICLSVQPHQRRRKMTYFLNLL
ncbi:unnamed protein product, partial [Staurois parvus]